MKPNRSTAHDDTGFVRLRDVCARLRFDPHDIARQLDGRGRYDEELSRDFPLLVRLFHYTSRLHTRGATWHERLELFLPLDGPTRFRMGDQEIALAPGDLLVVDNLKLHHVVDFPGFDTRAIVISFLPEFVYSLGSPSHDYVFLLPFYGRPEQHPHRLRHDEAAAGAVHRAVAGLLETFFATEPAQLRYTGCKAHFLTLLHHLARHWSGSEVMKWEFLREQQRTQRLKPLFEHIRHHFAEKLTVAQAARMVNLSPAQFMKLFKKVAGMTLIAYLNHVRLANAARRLKESADSIAAVAIDAGFADQSYFDKQFKRAFGCPPREFRQGERTTAPNRRSPRLPRG